VWKWPSVPGDSHDVKLTKTRPKGVKRWQSDIAVSDYTYKKKLKVKGKYVVICSLHPNSMRQKIIVR
jgi:plastocyanin